MEPSPKRQRLYSVVSRQFSRPFANHHEYEIPDSEIEDVEAYEQEDEGVNALIHDPDFEHDQRRAQAEYKLKSTLEAIFEKYGKDFDGIGDEIDLATGDIVVNNGHLIEMRDEKDAGGIQTLQRELEEETTESEEGPDSFVGDDNLLDELGDEEEEGQSNEGGMMEDDMILRGFTQATQFLQSEPYLSIFQASSQPQEKAHHLALSRPSLQSTVHPSGSGMFSQIGTQLGPQIVEYSLPQVRDDSYIEPAWRIPEFPGTPLRGRSLDKPSFAQSTIFQPSSPDNSPSLWAPSGQRRRRRARRGSNELEGLSFHHKSSYRTGSLDSLKSTTSLGGRTQIPRPHLVRNLFTTTDDDLLIRCVKRARKHSVALSPSFWKDVEAKYPRHTWKSWRWRYHQKHLAYLESSPPPEIETATPMSTSTTSTDVYKVSKPLRPGPNMVDTTAYQSRYDADNRRPKRTRKSSQKDSNIVSWSEAVNSLKSLDPELHSGILHDIRRNNNDEGHWIINQPTPKKPYISSNGPPDEDPKFNQGNHLRHDNLQALRESNRRYSDLAYNHEHLLEKSSGFNRVLSQDGSINLAPTAPCPHIDSKSCPTNVYSVQRMATTELPQITLHHTAPVPCREARYSLEGDHKFVTQKDLAAHVRISHLGTGTLHQLPGQADLGIPGQSRLRGSSEPPQIMADSDKYIWQRRDSDPISPDRENDSHISSSSVGGFPPSSEHDQALTPQGTTNRASYTPMTSVSSLLLDHPWGKIDETPKVANFEGTLPVSHPQMYDKSPSGCRTPNRQGCGSDLRGNHETREQLFKNHLASPDLGNRVAQRNELKQVPSPAIIIQDNSDSNSVANPRTQGRKDKEAISRVITSPSAGSRTSEYGNPLDSAGSESRNPKQLNWKGGDTSQNQIGNGPAELNSTRRPRPTSKESLVLVLPRNLAHPSPSQEHINTPTEKYSQKPISAEKYSSEDVDELSLDSEDLILLSSRRRTAKKPLGLPVDIKRDDTPNLPYILSARPSRKRKLNVHEGSDEIDELVGDEAAFSSPGIKPIMGPQLEIKEESAEPCTARPLFKDVKPKYKSPLQGHPKSGIMKMSPQAQSLQGQNIRVQTPPLNLTATRHTNPKPESMKEVIKSVVKSPAAHSSQLSGYRRTQRQSQPRGTQTSSSVDGPLTPTRRKPDSEVQVEQGGPAIVIKTPGGTFRSCGKDEFVCKKSFCFRCSANDA